MPAGFVLPARGYEPARVESDRPFDFGCAQRPGVFFPNYVAILAVDRPRRNCTAREQQQAPERFLCAVQEKPELCAIFQAKPVDRDSLAICGAFYFHIRLLCLAGQGCLQASAQLKWSERWHALGSTIPRRAAHTWRIMPCRR